jgi:hypothetical protein
VGAIFLALRRSDAMQLEEHLARADRRIEHRPGAPDDQQESAIGTLRARVVALFARERAEELEDLRRAHVHRGRELQLGERVGVVATGAREMRELHVHLRALGRTTTAVPLNEPIEEQARLVVATGATKRIGQRNT